MYYLRMGWVLQREQCQQEAPQGQGQQGPVRGPRPQLGAGAGRAGQLCVAA